MRSKNRAPSLGTQAAAHDGYQQGSLNAKKGERDTISALDAILGLAPEVGRGEDEEPDENVTWVEAPLKRISGGPMLPGGSAYRMLALRFPCLATSRQRKAVQTGVSLDFILDTGSTVNVLMPAVAAELALPLDAEVTPAGWGAQGAIAAAPQFVLGDCQLDHLPEDKRFVLMTGLKASGLMVPSPGAAGILGRAFMDSFPAVEFRLQVGGRVFIPSFPTSTSERSLVRHPPLPCRLSLCSHREHFHRRGLTRPGTGDAPAGPQDNVIRFHSEWDSSAAQEQESLLSMDVELLGETGLWGVRVDIGDSKDVPALLDTGSPVTVLNSACASRAGLQLPAGPQGKGSESLVGRLFGGGNKRQTAAAPALTPASSSVSMSLSTTDGKAELGELGPCGRGPSWV